MEVYLLHHTHLDIGYTHRQDEVERIQWASLEEALRLGEASADYPEGDRFVWNPEGIWPVDTYVRAHPGEKADRLLEGIRRGWIELDGMYAGLLTGLANEETLLHAFDASRSLSERSGVPIESEMLSDIPGFSWGLVEALSRNGIRYLSIGPNFGHRIGHFTEALGDRPFWWEGPSGQSRVLTWVSGGGYAWFHTGLGYDSITAQLDEEKIFRYLDQLFSGDYPYGMTYLRYNIGSDNGPPDPGLADAVRRWNVRYTSPVLRISGTTEAFRTFESRYGPALPSFRGDLTGYWEDGAASSARETALVRRVAESLPQSEKLAAMRGVSLDPGTLAEAWRQVLLFYEHTWGSWNSISEPYSDLTEESWERKKAFAERAVELAGALRAAAMGEDGAGGIPAGRSNPTAPAPAVAREGRVVEVINTLPWTRSDLILLGEEASSGVDRVLGPEGDPAPSQRLHTGEMAFLARNIPGESAVRFTLVPGGDGPWMEESPGEGRGASVEEGPPPSPTPLQGASGFQTRDWTVGVDSMTGDLVSLIHRASGRELIDPSAGGANQYLYVPGRDPAAVVGSDPASVGVVESGPLVWSVVSRGTAPGLRAPMTREVRVVDGLDRVTVVDRLPKAWVLDPEAVLLRFSFAVQDPQARIDAPFGSYRPELDQIQGASKNYFSLQRWVDVSEPEWGVTLVSVDAPLIQLGEIRTDAVVTGWMEEAESSSTILSYVMNNYWETNYRAAQDDEVELRYTFRPHEGFEEEEAERLGLEVARPLLHRVSGGPGG
jgi:hypothetical protein